MTKYWWDRAQDIKPIHIDTKTFPFKTGTPGQRAVVEIEKLTQQLEEVQALYIQRLEELEELQTTEEPAVTWDSEPSAVAIAVATPVQLTTQASVLEKVKKHRRDLENKLLSQRHAVTNQLDELIRATSHYNTEAGAYYQHMASARHDRKKPISCAVCNVHLCTIAVYGVWVQKVYQHLSGKKYKGAIFNG